MTLESNLIAAFQTVGADMKAVRASGPVAFDSAARRADAVLNAGATLDSGHRYTVRANEDAARFKVASGALIHDRGGASGTQTTTAAAYAGTQLPGPVGRIWVDFQVTDSTTEDVVLIVSGGSRPFTQPQVVSSGIVGSGFSDAACHLVVNPNGWSYGVLTDTPWTIDEIANGAFQPALEAGVTHTMRVDFDGAKVTVTTPRGVQVSATDTRIGTTAYRGPYAAIELYSDTGIQRSAAKIVSWGAAQEAPVTARAFAPAPLPETAAAMFAPATQLDVTAPSSSTDIAPGFALPVIIPTSQKLLVTASYWLEQTGADATYVVGLNVGAGTGDGWQRVVIGPHNGYITIRWLYQLNAPGALVTLSPEHHLAGTGAATAKFSNDMGFYGILTASPVQ